MQPNLCVDLNFDFSILSPYFSLRIANDEPARFGIGAKLEYTTEDKEQLQLKLEIDVLETLATWRPQLSKFLTVPLGNIFALRAALKLTLGVDADVPKFKGGLGFETVFEGNLSAGLSWGSVPANLKVENTFELPWVPPQPTAYLEIVDGCT